MSEAIMKNEWPMEESFPTEKALRAAIVVDGTDNYQSPITELDEFIDPEIMPDLSDDDPEDQQVLTEADDPFGDYEETLSRQSMPTNDIVRMYLQELRGVPLLTAEQEVVLAKQIEAGVYAADRLLDDQWLQDSTLQYFEAGLLDSQDVEILKNNLAIIAHDGVNAKQHMIKANLRLVVSIAKHYTGRGLEILDLIQEGNIGLNRAVEKFDYTKGFKFSTYGTWWIRQYVTRAIAESALSIRMPVYAVEVVNKIRKQRKIFLQENGREPDLDELADLTDVTPKTIVMYGKLEKQEPISYNTPFDDDPGSELGERIFDESSVDEAYHLVEAESLREDVMKVLRSSLDGRSLEIIIRRYGILDGRCHTLREVGDHFGVTRERIRQLQKLAETTLKNDSRMSGLKEYIYDED